MKPTRVAEHNRAIPVVMCGSGDCHSIRSKGTLFAAAHYVCFSNRPVRVKRFQTIHQNSFEVTRGLVLLYGIGT